MACSGTTGLLSRSASKTQTHQLNEIQSQLDSIQSTLRQQEWDREDAQRRAELAAQQAKQQAEQARSDSEWMLLREQAAKQGYIIDKSGWKPRLVPMAEYRAEQERKQALRLPMEITTLPPKARAANPKFIAFTVFYERKKGDRNRELKGIAKKLGAIGWSESERKQVKRFMAGGRGLLQKMKISCGARKPEYGESLRIEE